MPDAIVIDTPEDISYYQLLVLRSALKLHVKGMRMSRGMSAMKAGRRLGFTGRTAAAMLPQVEAAIEALSNKETDHDH